MNLNTMNLVTGSFLRTMALMFNTRPKLRRYMRDGSGWINFSVGFSTLTGTVKQSISFKDGRVSVSPRFFENTDATLRFTDNKALIEMMMATPNAMLNLILKNRIMMEGNLSHLQIFNFYIALLMGRIHQMMHERAHREDIKARRRQYAVNKPELSTELSARRKYRLKCERVDSGVKYLEDPYLSTYALDDFPRLQRMLDRHFNIKPQICAERPKLLTEWFKKNGFEKDSEGRPRHPGLRQAYAFKYLMENRQAIIAPDELIAGTSTSKVPTGVIIYPDAQGTMIWGELLSVEKRMLNPYQISPEDVQTLHQDVFPFWIQRNFREAVRAKYGNPLCQSIDERFIAYFVWKSVGISHTIPDFSTVLKKGTGGIIADIRARLEKGGLNDDQMKTLQAMIITLEGVNAYSANLSREASRMAAREKDEARKGELARLAEICGRIPVQPSRSLDEAVNLLWIMWVALHMENTNTGLSLGRLDQLLQPYFEKDMEKLSTPEQRRDYIKKAIELVGCYFMRGTDHLPLVPDIGNYLFGGSSSDQAITLGGVTPEGKDAVNDMTYIFLKSTEILCIRDPNVNARFHPGVNSDAYLKRLCEVNFITAATPSMHNDKAVFASLAKFGYPLEDMRDWSATGCVEPTLSGKHMGHTGSILMNMVAALEMALNNGRHPLMKWDLGPKTGNPENGDFKTFEDFFQAYMTQQKFLIDEAVTLNNRLAEIHAEYRPTPLLSAMIEGAVEKGRDVTRGGARYNSSGSSNIGLADVTDSLLVIRKLVFDEKKITFAELKHAIDNNFADHPALHALVKNKVALFGSGNEEALAMAKRVAKEIHACWSSHTNYRGGPYTAGFWSMSQHVAYGSLSGALPSGKLAGKAFTPGLTPHPSASPDFLNNIRDVAHLEPQYMDNNIAFNVKLIPSVKDSREKTVDHMYAYAKTYFGQGGMQMQFNVVNSDVLKDAMANPDNYRNLLVRISGYNAYFVTLNKEMQIELIERAQYGV